LLNLIWVPIPGAQKDIIDHYKERMNERERYWRESQHQANGRKRFTLGKLPPLERMLGGLRNDEEGRLRLVPDISSGDYAHLFSARRDRLVYEEDERTGESVTCTVTGLFVTSRLVSS
jgi:hypothetical protein